MGVPAISARQANKEPLQFLLDTRPSIQCLANGTVEASMSDLWDEAGMADTDQRREDDVLRRMLATKLTPHKPVKDKANPK